MVNSIDEENTSTSKSINDKLQPAITALNEDLKNNMAREDHLDQRN